MTNELARLAEGGAEGWDVRATPRGQHALRDDADGGDPDGGDGSDDDDDADGGVDGDDADAV